MVRNQQLECLISPHHLPSKRLRDERVFLQVLHDGVTEPEVLLQLGGGGESGRALGGGGVVAAGEAGLVTWGHVGGQPMLTDAVLPCREMVN